MGCFTSTSDVNHQTIKESRELKKKKPRPEGFPCKLDTQRECNRTGQAPIGRQVAAKDNCLCSWPGQPVICHLRGSLGEGQKSSEERTT